MSNSHAQFIYEVRTGVREILQGTDQSTFEKAAPKEDEIVQLISNKLRLKRLAPAQTRQVKEIYVIQQPDGALRLDDGMCVYTKKSDAQDDCKLYNHEEDRYRSDVGRMKADELEGRWAVVTFVRKEQQKP